MGWYSWRVGRGIEPGRFPLHDGNIFFRSDVETNRPVDHRRIPDVDIFIHRDANLRIAANIARASVQRTPNVSRSGLPHLDYAKGLAAAAHFVMDSNIEHCRIAAVEAEIFVNYYFGSGVLDLTALAGRKLAHQRRIDRLATMSDARDVHEGRNASMSHVTGIFAERSFRLDPFGRYFALDDDLRSRGNMQVHSLAADHFDGLACQSTGETIFIEVVGQL